MTVQEIADKYVGNPYGIGANIVVDDKEYVTLKFPDSYSRNKTMDNIKSMGVKGKDMRMRSVSKAYLYRYELILYKS